MEKEKLVVRGVELTDLLGVPYGASRHPGNISVDEFLANPKLGANCQLLGLGAVRRGGFYINETLPMDQGGRFGSKELWLDTQYTKLVIGGWCPPQILWKLFLAGELHVFDIYFFLPPSVDLRGNDTDTDEELFKKLHIAIFTGFDFGGHELGSDPRRAFLHNAKPGPSALWSMNDFEEKGYRLFGVKRPIRTIT